MDILISVLPLTQTLNSEQQLCETVYVFKDGEKHCHRFLYGTVVLKARGKRNSSWHKLEKIGYLYVTIFQGKFIKVSATDAGARHCSVETGS
jgi:hypothetical protein